MKLVNSWLFYSFSSIEKLLEVGKSNLGCLDESHLHESGFSNLLFPTKFLFYRRTFLMSRYTGPSWKQSRRLGLSLTGTGKELARRNYVPGQHGPNNRSKLSEYGLQLAEKQKLRFTYGLGEKQFRNLFVQATKVKGGTLGFNFMVLLERRLDNVVYRLGLATTRRQARQFVNHGHILVDGKRVDIPSYRVTPGQVISVREKSAKVPAILEAVEATLGRPAFVSFDAEKLEGTLTRLPERDEINPEINEALIVEFYNKML
jgi:small subunit ribosomal protein S4